ncbi:MAG: hypothetical protein HY958_12590 [Bacteroidia bacterium]|nr:hypothetical protein [Bacteroidia bacterium]
MTDDGRWTTDGGKIIIIGDGWNILYYKIIIIGDGWKAIGGSRSITCCDMITVGDDRIAVGDSRETDGGIIIIIGGS